MKKYMIVMLMLTLMQEPLRADGLTFVEGFFIGMFTYITIRELVPTLERLQHKKDNEVDEQQKVITSTLDLACGRQEVDSARTLLCEHQYLCPVCQLEHDNHKKEQNVPRKKRNYVPLKGAGRKQQE